MLPDFALAPWEAGILPDGEPLCAPATRRIEVRQGWRKITYFIRDIPKPAWSLSRILVQRDVPDAATLVLNFDLPDPRNPASRVKSDADLIKAIKNRSWTRMVCLNSDMRLLVQGEIATHKFVVLGDNRTYFYSNVGSGCPTEFLLDGRPRKRGWGETIPVRRIEALVNRGWRKKNSDCHFALRWASLSFEEHVRWLYKFERGTLDECEEVLRWFVISGSWWDSSHNASLHPNLWEDNKEGRKSKNPLPLNQSRLIVIPNFISTADIEAKWIELSAAHRQLLSVLDRYFGLRYNEECWSHIRLGLQRSTPWIIQVLEVPTQHERLEAHLQLCDWLRDKVAPDELAALLDER